ncbi:uncharacterized protein FIBRA_01192 [Fibroporia radiculosa]|uniref:Uncharacterized protein n=1 Tax=Fibroporia radiculosa TaxID=599839 RepID=J4HSX1_9APHY|nr:uncharacterized protein FIBRA_01192 [Fibroporia radiculosa]CCL99177.1 predicted protein [Fibroporia radiculosa]
MNSPSPVDSSSSFFSNVLTPGSSLHPTFLLVVDGAFGALLVVLLALAAVTRGNLHFFALILIELGLWASVKWFVHELQNVPAQEGQAATAGGKKQASRLKDD